jgi:triosephosphate isomerase (TIM)
MRTKIVAGNWKMNKTWSETLQFFNDLKRNSHELPKNVEVIVAPPSLYLSQLTNESQPVILAAQNAHQENKGAFTGEISCSMLKSLNIDYCIIGHSERRMYFNESNELVEKKVKAALANEVSPILCCGETLEEREANTHFDIIESQLSFIKNLSVKEVRNIVIAYEPVWAIGTGKTASSEQAQEIHQFIRNLLSKWHGEELANQIRILYGGSCKPDNALELFNCPDIDGGLIGGASLVPEDFIAIIKSAATAQ